MTLNSLRRLRQSLTCLLALLPAATALAQDRELPAFELERLELNPNGAGSLVIGTGELLPQGSWRLGLAGHYQNDPLVYYRNGERLGSVVEHRVLGHLVGAWSPLSWLELSAQLPVVLWQQGQDLSAQGLRAVAAGGLATPVLSARVGLLSQREGRPMDLALELGTGLPVGSAGALGWEPGLRLAPRVMAGWRGAGLLAAVQAGALVRQPTALGDLRSLESRLGSELRLGAALATTGPGLRGELDVRASLPLAQGTPSVEVLGGVRLPLNRSLEAFALGGPGFGVAPGTPTFRAVLGVALAGPTAPGPASEHDSDGDGVKDSQDACPNEPGPAERQGCPVRDADGDTVEDVKDACPTEPGLVELQGCPMKDADKDGVEDAKDACPVEPGPVERQGCPVKDADGDTVEDVKDACPTEPGLVELRGCPKRDADGDGVADAVDNCPTEKGPASNHGCPEKERQLVAIKPDRLEIKGVVLFQTGKAILQGSSFRLLDQVASVLKAHPEITQVSIEGHTDNVGGAEFNDRLSQARAESVRVYLVGQGVDPWRLKAHGFGLTRPVASNDNARGRAANRRVEFIILTPEAQP